MATKSVSEILIGRSTILYGDVGSEPVTPVGYKTGKTTFKYDEKISTHDCEDTDLPIFATRDSSSCSLSANLVQVTPEIIALAIGKTAVGATVPIGGPIVPIREVSLKCYSVRRDGTIVTVKIGRAFSNGKLTLDFDKTKMTEIPLDFSALAALDENENAGSIIFGDEDGIAATIASGVLTRTALTGYVLVSGQGAAADVLDSITGTSLVNGEILRLQIASATMPITLTHLADTLELLGEVNWTMTNINSWIEFEYSLAKTGWVEKRRYNAGA